MEIVRFEVSTQRHIDQMRETAKVNYVQYGKGSKLKNKSKSGGKLHGTANGSSGSSGILETHPSPVERVRKFHHLQTFAGDVAKADTKGSMYKLFHKRT